LSTSSSAAVRVRNPRPPIASSSSSSSSSGRSRTDLRRHLNDPPVPLRPAAGGRGRRRKPCAPRHSCPSSPRLPILLVRPSVSWCAVFPLVPVPSASGTPSASTSTS
ncbi:unnamed protein product, partial [Ectocarpus sp. 12 AP-2014]